MRPSTLVNPQQQLAILAEAGRPTNADGDWISRCDTMLDAIHLCIHLSRIPHYAIAEQLGIDKGHWARMLQSQAHFPPNKLVPLMNICGNYAPVQWLAQKTGHELFKDAKAARKAELLAELAEIDRRAA